MSTPRLDKAKLVELLAEAHEHEALDYKSHVDLSDRLAELELIKDIAAFCAAGGYLVIGADNGGSPTGMLTAAQVALFDESRLRAKVKRHVPEPLEMRTACHEIDGALFVLVYIGPSPDGFAVISADGQTGDKVVFRRGDVFVRHGTASERWDPRDFAQIKEALINRNIGLPELVPAPPSTHRTEAPRLVHTGTGQVLYQRVLVEVENVGSATATVLEARADGYDAGGSLGTLRPALAIPPYLSRPFELNAVVADEDGLPVGSEITLRIAYEAGNNRRDLVMTIRYHRAGGFENAGHASTSA